MRIEHEYNGKKTGVYAEMVCDSVALYGTERISTLVVKMPRIVLAELNTHKDLSRNSASSRAVPAKTLRARVRANPYIPWRWPDNGKGMVPGSYIDSGWRAHALRAIWIFGLYLALLLHWMLEKVGLHKEVANRLLEPWMFTEVLLTATEWRNFLIQRCHYAAQDGIRAVAECVRELLERHTPTKTDLHLPYITTEERAVGSVYTLMLASARRCRRVSFLRQGLAVALSEDASEGLSGLKETPQHKSPYEHMAAAFEGKFANLRGWRSLRTEVETDHGLVEKLVYYIARSVP